MTLSRMQLEAQRAQVIKLLRMMADEVSGRNDNLEGRPVTPMDAGAQRHACILACSRGAVRSHLGEAARVLGIELDLDPAERNQPQQTEDL